MDVHCGRVLEQMRMKMEVGKRVGKGVGKGYARKMGSGGWGGEEAHFNLAVHSSKGGTKTFCSAWLALVRKSSGLSTFPPDKKWTSPGTKI